MKKINKKSQLGSFLSLFIATIAIAVVLLIFVFAASFLARTLAKPVYLTGNYQQEKEIRESIGNYSQIVFLKGFLAYSDFENKILKLDISDSNSKENLGKAIEPLISFDKDRFFLLGAVITKYIGSEIASASAGRCDIQPFQINLGAFMIRYCSGVWI